MSEARKQRLADFVTWVGDHITGDEKGQAQIFLDRLFQAFGQKGYLEVGGTPECRIRKSKEDGGGIAFADYVWKPVVLIEMKKRGADLAQHFRQAFDYWVRLVPDRPQFVILSNFDEFWVYDFNTQMDSPVDRVKLADLPERFGPLNFLFPTNETPVFGNDHEKVTRKAANLLATCFNKLVVRGVSRDEAQRFILQTLVALFAEDIGLLQRYQVLQLLEECKQPRDSYDLLGGLFTEMNTPGRTAGGRYKGTDYFNGGLFAEPSRLELHPDEVTQLRNAADSDWSQVRPEIFGTLFEHSLGTDERHAFGAHFTSPVDIMKIVGPTIVDPWTELIENATTVKQLNGLLARMHRYRVLDPACGSGNFLYIAYRELKRLEADIYGRIARRAKATKAAGQKVFGFVSAEQFFGMDITPFAVELAKVTMMIGRKLAIDELHITEPALPLDNLDKNFQACDSLIDELGNRTPWPEVDVIIGNPPFLGAKLLKPERGPDYVNAVRKLYPEVPGMADYCVYWLYRSHEHLPNCTPEDPVAGRAGLVGTQNIRNNKSREGGLDYIVASGTVVEAVDNQPWSGEANVHVSIANWVKHPAHSKKHTATEIRRLEAALLIPEKRKLWFRVETKPNVKKPSRNASGPKHKRYELDYRNCEEINSSLSDRISVSGTKTLRCNTHPKRCFQGVVPGYNGFILSHSLANEFLNEDPTNSTVVRPYMTGNEMILKGEPQRYIVDFSTVTQFEARAYNTPFAYLQEHVLPAVDNKATSVKGTDMEKARLEHLERWWQFWNVRREMRVEFTRLNRFIALSRTTKRQIVCFVSVEIVPDCQLQTFALNDDYSWSILSSRWHWEWFLAKCSKQTERLRYSGRSVFETYPWPQAPKESDVTAVAEAGREVRRVREQALAKIKGGLRAVYRTLELPGKNPLKDAHADLDAAVLQAYGFSAKKDLLKQLLDLNLEVATQIEAGQEVTAPGIPPGYPNPESLVTEDCIRPG